MKIKSVFVTVLLFVILLSTCIWAISPDDATIVGTQFIAHVIELQGGWGEAREAYVMDFNELRRGDFLLGYHLSIYPHGHILVSPLKQFPPVKSFSTTCDFDTESEEGYWGLLKDTIKATLLFLQKKYGTLKEEELPDKISPACNREAWEGLLELRTHSTESTIVGPLLQTAWEQGTPFNDYCPMGDGGRCVAGCVAIAAAQVMKYWNHPSSGTGSHSYEWDGDGSVPGQTLSATFSDSYDWGNMKDKYGFWHPYNDAEAAAVAELCYEVGVAFEMDYGQKSGAWPSKGLTAFPEYFKYKDSITMEHRSNYANADAWFERIKEELNAASPRPMMYYIWDGLQNGFAHEIVCDGYWEDGIDYIHMNYGWAGSYDNWYAVDNLYCGGDCDYLKEDMLCGIQPNNPPNTPLAPTGPDSGSPDTPHYFAAATFDPDGDQVCYKFDWGDGSESDWTGFVDSGSAAGEYHSWSSKGIYEVKVKAKDANDAESGWSEAHTIVINNPPNTPSVPSGPDSGTPSTSYDFTATTTDPDGDQVAFKFDWGDSSESDWTDFVDSGASASASRSWANDGTYQVKAKAKDINDTESGWSEAHTIVISRPDLTITSISPDAASVDQQVDIIVTVTNQGAQDVTQDFFVDVYYDPSSSPDKGQYGDERQQITETVQAGESIEVTFTHTFNSSGDHEVWAQVDSSDLVSETDENNNIYGSHTIAVSERRHENESFSLPAGKWKMISIPFTLDDSSPNAVLVDDLGTQNDAVWKLYRWNTANESYDKYPNVGDFSAGKSFWIISEDAKTVDTGPGTDVSRQSDFVISLPSGWSQIGNPFPFSVDWNEVRVRRNAEVVSILEAQARGWVRDKIWYWDGQSYLVYQAPSGTIDPYEGYWAKALLDCELLVSPNEAQGAKASGQTVNSKEEFLQLKAKVGELKDNFNFLGFSENAKDGYDRLDIEEAPPISPYISLFFPHPEWEKNKGNYTQDIRTRSSQAGLKWFWDFQVKTNQVKKEIILEWENTSAISEELYLYLTDSLSNVLVNMREKSSYRFTLSSELESFKIIATCEALPLPQDLNLTEVYGYPNPAHGAGAKFHFHLASWAKVTIKIYTISGELVRTLVEDKVFLPGACEEFWEEKNDKGEKLARGVYIFIIQAGNPAKVISKSGKIALLE